MKMLKYFIKNCPGPCAGKCSKSEYQKNIKNVKLFFEGKKQRIIASLKKEMKQASKTQSYEKAARIRDQIRALEHIEGTAAITHKEKRGVALSELGKVLGLKIDIGFRVEAYDISNLFGKEATGSMVVFSGGIPQKEEYRKFKIKTVDSINDYAMFSEVFRRRFSGTHKDWADPDLIILDGGQGQLRIVREVLRRLGVKIPILAIAKSPSRKKIDLYFEKDGKFHYIPTSKVGTELINLLTQIREEAHRFAISYHKILRRKNLIGK